jgi:type IV pili sensor histidine kinase/response regulator
MRQSSRLLGLAVLSAVMAEAILLSGCAMSAAPPTSALADDASALRRASGPRDDYPDPAAPPTSRPSSGTDATLVELVPNRRSAT